jgi:hypothetical protein
MALSLIQPVSQSRSASRSRTLAGAVVGSLILHAGILTLLAGSRGGGEGTGWADQAAVPVTLTLAPSSSPEGISPWPEPVQRAEVTAPPLETQERQPALPPNEPVEPKAPKEPEVSLGVDDGAAPTENMLGAARPEENLAPKATVDQPALALEPGAPGTPGELGSTGEPADAPAPPSQDEAASAPQQPSPSSPQLPPPFPPPAPPTMPQQAEPPQPPQNPQRSPSVPQTVSMPAADQNERDELVQVVNEFMPGARPASEAFAAPPPAPALTDEQPEPAPEATPPRRPEVQSPAQPQISASAPAPTSSGAKAGGDSRLPGQRADSESEAFSSVGSLEFRPGTPLAGKGLRIRTVLPRFSITTRLMASPRNPVIVVRFSRAGKVLSATFENDQGTGYEDVDVPLLAAVHRWTATGDQLTQIPAGDAQAGVAFKIKYILRE